MPFAPPGFEALHLAVAQVSSSESSRTEAVQTAAVQVTFPAPEQPRLARPAVVPVATEAPRPRSTGTPRAADLAQQLHRLEEQIASGNKVIADMLDRVALMEREVAEMRARVQSLPGVGGAAAPRPAGAVVPQAAVREQPTAELDTAERSRRNQMIIDNALLLLAAGVLLLLIGVAYWTWGRPALKDRLREVRASRTAPAA
ncbi:MAG: hypothetical protein K2W84_01045 [Burkholderiales bacterium]|nr:hypothetical protein [Burkholderiales bacterium]